MKLDESLDNLLLLDGEHFVIYEKCRLWVKFEARLVRQSIFRPHGLKYALTLHNRRNRRIMGFDNAHPVWINNRKRINPHSVYDHWHYDEKDSGTPYNYRGADILLADFWREVDRVIQHHEEMES